MKWLASGIGRPDAASRPHLRYDDPQSHSNPNCREIGKMHRSALVAMKPGATNRELLEFAVDLACENDLTLVGEVIFDHDRVAPPEAVPLGAAAFKTELDEERRNQFAHQTAEVRAQFEAACSAALIRHEFQELEGELAGSILFSAQRHDLVLLGRQSPDESATLGLILKQCPCPALIVPTAAKPRGPVLVAYDASRASAVAVVSFVNSGLFAKEAISILCVDADLRAGRVRARAAADNLLRHGRTVQSLVEKPRVSVAETILATVDELGAGLVVMGAFGQPAIREFFVGSVTKDLMHRLAVPMWIDH